MRRLRWPMLVLLLLMAAAAGAARVQTACLLAPLPNEAFDDTEVDALIADQQRLVAMNLFPAGGHHDAGELLNRFVKLDGGTPEEAAPDAEAPWANNAVRNALTCPPSDPDNFPACVQAIPTVDTSVLSALMPYDRWDPASSGAWHRYLATPRKDDILTFAIPSFLDWNNLAKLRLVQGMLSGSVLPAIQEVRQLARLSWSTENLIGEMIAVNMLNQERRTYNAAVAKGLIPADAWTPVSEDDTRALKRVAFGMAGFYSGQAPNGALDRLHAAVPAPLAECSGVAEGMVTARLNRALFAHPWPGELTLPSTEAAIDAVVHSGRCRLPYVAELWNDPRRDLDILGDTTPLQRLTYQIPFLRQLLGASLLEMAAPHWNQFRDPPS